MVHSSSEMDHSPATTSKPTVNQTKIREQLEFYFSDSNLSKDRFLLNEIKTNSKDGCKTINPKATSGLCSHIFFHFFLFIDVDLKLFLKFNKIISLSSNVEEIAEAVRCSSFLQLDESGKMVKRRVEYVPPSQVDMDNRTVYAVNRSKSLQPSCRPLDRSFLDLFKENVFGDAETIKRHFSKHGKVAYVSVPKFKTSNQMKGFAFVEFEDQSSADACIKVIEHLHLQSARLRTHLYQLTLSRRCQLTWQTSK